MQQTRELDVNAYINATPEQLAAMQREHNRSSGEMCFWVVGVPLVAYLGYRLIRRAVAAGVRDAQRRQ